MLVLRSKVFAATNPFTETRGQRSVEIVVRFCFQRFTTASSIYTRHFITGKYGLGRWRKRRIDYLPVAETKTNYSCIGKRRFPHSIHPPLTLFGLPELTVFGRILVRLLALLLRYDFELNVRTHTAKERTMLERLHRSLHLWHLSFPGIAFAPHRQSFVLMRSIRRASDSRFGRSFKSLCSFYASFP